MADLLNALWELRTVIVFLAGVTAGLVFAIFALAVMSRVNEPKREDEQPIGDVVDIRQFIDKWDDK